MIEDIKVIVTSINNDGFFMESTAVIMEFLMVPIYSYGNRIVGSESGYIRQSKKTFFSSKYLNLDILDSHEQSDFGVVVGQILTITLEGDKIKDIK